MKRVTKALEEGKLSIAVSGALLRDPQVMLALKERGALNPMALSGPVVAPVVPVSEAGVARSMAEPGGILAIIGPESADMTGLQELGKLIKQAKHKPKVLVVARSFNPLQFAMMMPGIDIDHVKDRGTQFFKKLPEIPDDLEDAPVPDVPVVKSKRGSSNAPRFDFVGREEELEILKGYLAEPGPIFISGPKGVGRTWLAAQAIEDAELDRLPDMFICRGAGFDTLVGRLALICKQNGASQLMDHLDAKDKTPTSIIEATIASLQGADLGGKAMVIQGIDRVIGRSADFFRKSRLEMLLVELLTTETPLRLVFVGEDQPVFYREGAASALRRMKLEGLQGREYYDVFQSYKAPEFPREKIGPLTDKLHGHPMAVRTYAIAVRDDGEQLLDDDKFMKAKGVDDLSSLRKYLKRQVNKLDKKDRRALATLAHMRMTFDGQLVSSLKIKRDVRLGLLALGLLNLAGTEKARLYRVHSLVRRQLSRREVTDFKTFVWIAETLQNEAKNAGPIESLALLQEANRMCIAGRRLRNRRNLDIPDNDALIDDVYGMIRGRKTNYNLAQQRIAEVLNRDPSNSDAHIAKIELVTRMKEKKQVIDATIEEATDKAQVPEVFHQGVNHYLRRRQRNKAIALMEKAVDALPDESRLRTRLASLLMRQGRRPEAIEQLKTAMEQDPMLPDAYGILGMLKRDEGADALEEAEALLREAVRLAPGDAVQMSRLAGLLFEKADVVEEDEAKALYEELTTLLEEALHIDKKSPEIHLLHAQLLLDQGKSPDRVAWFLKKTRKLANRGFDRSNRVRLQEARLELLRGNLDKAEKHARQMAKKDPSNPKVFLFLAHVLEARKQFIPAHAELLRAKERTNPATLLHTYVEHETVRLQKRIEAQAAGLAEEAPAEPDEASDAGEAKPTATGNVANRVLRRPAKKADSGEGAQPEAAPPEASEAAAVTTTEDAVEATDDAVEATDDTVSTPEDGAQTAAGVETESVETPVAGDETPDPVAEVSDTEGGSEVDAKRPPESAEGTALPPHAAE